MSEIMPGYVSLRAGTDMSYEQQYEFNFSNIIGQSKAVKVNFGKTYWSQSSVFYEANQINDSYKPENRYYLLNSKKILLTLKSILKNLTVFYVRLVN